MDAVGLSSDALEKRRQYRASAWSRLKSRGLLIITSCNSTPQELQASYQLHLFNDPSPGLVWGRDWQVTNTESSTFSAQGLAVQEEFCRVSDTYKFQYVSKVGSYPVFRFGGHEGTKVCTLAFETVLES